MRRLYVSLLGEPEISAEGGSPTADPGRKALALLAFLASRPGARASRAEVAQLLWSDAPSTGAARQALRQCLFRMRRSLGAEAVVSDGSALWLDPATITFDLWQLEAALACGDADDLIAAATSCGGAFCATLDVASPDFECWLRDRRIDVAHLAAEANRQAVAVLAARARPDAALAAARRRLVYEPYEEAAHAALIALLQRHGRRQEARMVHAACQTLFEQDLGVAPGPEVDDALRTAPSCASPVTAAPVPQRRPPTLPAGLAAVLAASVAWFAYIPDTSRSQTDDPMPSARLWVVSGGAHAEQATGPVPSAERWTIDEREAGNAPNENATRRALQGDPEFAQFYPVGC